ncbi:MAG: DUF1493 family protein [Chitinophagaceae bacterium]|nr:DUF1493 family protein [Chitinophagaceae bacterium]
MNDDILNDVRTLIITRMGKYKGEIVRGTMLEKDLGMTGDDAYEFLLEFSEKFNVKVSEFEFMKYFFPEGDSLFPSIVRFFTGKRNPKQGELTVGDLEKAVIAGRLDEEVIKK